MPNSERRTSRGDNDTLLAWWIWIWRHHICGQQWTKYMCFACVEDVVNSNGMPSAQRKFIAASRVLATGDAVWPTCWLNASGGGRQKNPLSLHEMVFDMLPACGARTTHRSTDSNYYEKELITSQIELILTADNMEWFGAVFVWCHCVSEKSRCSALQNRSVFGSVEEMADRSTFLSGSTSSGNGANN